MKLKAEDLSTMIRKIVREELQLGLKDAIRDHLTETYLRKIVSESGGKRRAGSSLAELMVSDTKTDEEIEQEEEIPRPKKAIDRGIYAPGANLANKKNEAVKKLIDSSPIGFVFETAKPIDQSEVNPGIPEETVEALTESMDFGRFLDGMDASAKSKKMMDQSPEAKLREIEMRRKALEVPVKR